MPNTVLGRRADHPIWHLTLGESSYETDERGSGRMRHRGECVSGRRAWGCSLRRRMGLGKIR